ncbi:hypothetical protein L3X38_016238 [Prunus dulcis]|uniref:Uncharacterized protein n=1 Tax=Prunus dulcis TaxID=3755 RepID=A0AAD4Z8Z7_PRUDU|nr:hypothetical protein L3X38_016238 [Prunus dulcis]
MRVKMRLRGKMRGNDVRRGRSRSFLKDFHWLWRLKVGPCFFIKIPSVCFLFDSNPSLSAIKVCVIERTTCFCAHEDVGLHSFELWLNTCIKVRFSNLPSH